MANPELMTGLGAALSIFLASAGSAVASVPAGIYATRTTGIKAFFPIVIAGVLAIYGTIISVILCSKFNDDLSKTGGYKNFSAGLAVGLACLASGMGMARFLNVSMTSPSPSPSGRRIAPSAEETPLIAAHEVPKLEAPTASFLMVLVFLEAIGLYGLIVALVLSG